MPGFSLKPVPGAKGLPTSDQATQAFVNNDTQQSSGNLLSESAVQEILEDRAKHPENWIKLTDTYWSYT